MAESAGSPLDLLVCSTCGSQHAVTASAGLKSCRICDDPRQYLPATGWVFFFLFSFLLKRLFGWVSVRISYI